VALAEKHRGSWYEWTAIHDGNCILGRLALKNGDIRRAALHLSDAGKACGSPWRGSLGPKMQFAQEMLRAGQREAVVSYLESCKAFWPCNTENLSTCITQIREGKSPRLAQDSFWVDLRIKSRSSMAVYGQAK
jgi:hypothetical protein